MAPVGCSERLSRRALLLLCLHPLLFSLCLADHDDDAECSITGRCPQTPNWVNLWYVWLILVTIFLLLLCGTTASCIKFCCKKKKPPVQTLPNQPYEVTVIAIDNESTIHSTVTSYSSVQYPHMFAFSDMDRSAMSPPAYSLYAMELPPAYEEAIKMAKPSGEVATSSGPKLEDITEHDGPEEDLEQQQTQQASSNDPESPPLYEEAGTTQSQVH